jgi:hypothetical protein
MQRTHVLEANLANLMIGELAGTEPVPQARFSSPYERVDVEIPPPEHRRTLRRAATISREDLAQRAKSRADAAAADFDAARTQRFSAPYAKVEIEELMQVPHAALTTGSFESAWFVAPDDVPAVEHEVAHPAHWMWILAVMLAVCAIAVVAITQ